MKVNIAPRFGENKHVPYLIDRRRRAFGLGAGLLRAPPGAGGLRLRHGLRAAPGGAHRGAALEPREVPQARRPRAARHRGPLAGHELRAPPPLLDLGPHLRLGPHRLLHLPARRRAARPSAASRSAR